MLIVNRARVKEMLLAGCVYAEIAKEFNTTKQNVSLWRKNWFPELGKKDIGASKRAVLRFKENPHTRINQSHPDDISRAKSLFFSRKKQNAKIKRWEFTVKFTDVVWNDVCPILGIPLNWNNDIRQDNSPSMDRKDSTKGYIPGNVEIVSWRANRIKNDGTCLEHQKIVDYLSR